MIKKREILYKIKQIQSRAKRIKRKEIQKIKHRKIEKKKITQC